MELSVINYCILMNLIVSFVPYSNSRSTEKDAGPKEEVELKLIVKRDVPLERQELPYVEGRTYRASEPIDPNSLAAAEQSDAPRSLLGDDFDTRHTIFQPEVNDEDDTGAQSQSEVTEGGEVEESQRSSSRSRSQTRGYAAQYPYQTTSDRQASSGSQTGTVQSEAYTSSGGEYTPSGSEILTRRRVQTYGGSSADTGTDYQSNTQRRTVTYSGGSGVGSQNPGYQTQSQTRLVAYGSGGSGSNPDTGSSYQTQSGSRMVVYGSSGSDGRGVDSQSQRRVVTYGGGGSGDTNTYSQPAGSSSRHYGTRNRNYFSTSTGYRPRSGQTNSQSYGTSTGSGRQYGSSSIRYENGRYYDSAGHEVDPYGRHRDDSGRLVSSSSNTGITQQGLPTAYDPIISQISDDPTCPSTNVRVRINGLLCNDAIRQLGPFVCYNYERVSRECCERCLQVKNPSHAGCEYGDRSYQCRNIQPFDCYVERNRQICCDKCREYREQMQASAAPNCEYGDLTPRCLNVRQRSHLCYLPENQRLCCATCPSLANHEEPGCRWGNQSPELCHPFDENGQVRLNCYMPAVREVCCATCKRLRARMRDEIPGCEYGDSPVQFSTGTEILDCAEYIGQYGVQNCQDDEIATKCCYTCYRYRNREAGRG